MALANLIDGAFVPARSGRSLPDYDPATGLQVATLPDSGAADIDAAVAAALRAQPSWAAVAIEERATFLERIADGLAAAASALARLETLDTGKPIDLSSTLDVPRAVRNFRFFAGQVRHDRTDAHHGSDSLNYTLRTPIGVVGLITPWNLPLYLLSWKVAPALAMGNCVVAKPSELTPLTAAALCEVVTAAGLPKGVFNLVHGTGPAAGEPLVAHPQVRAISFTGGTATGARVATTAAPLFKKLSLELGGKNPTLIFADADLPAAAAGAVRAAFLNQGQVCLCGSRILIERSVYEQVRDAIVTDTKALVVGDPMQQGTQLGALISPDHLAKVQGYLALARQEGGAILCGGDRPSLPPPLAGGAFLRPTVIDGLPPTCRTATEEIFGPVATVHPFATDQEAIEIANGVRYGLSASVWTSNLARAHRVSAAVHTGMVWVNTWLLRDLRVPFGGVKDSGLGREGGPHSLEFFSDTRNICIKL